MQMQTMKDHIMYLLALGILSEIASKTLIVSTLGGVFFFITKIKYEGLWLAKVYVLFT